MTFPIVSTLLYLFAFPLLVVFFCVFYKYLFITLAMRRRQKKNRKKGLGSKIDPNEFKKPIGPPLKKRLKFAFKDQRGFSLKKKPKKQNKLQNRWVMFGLYFVGLILAVVGGFMNSGKLIVVSLLVFVVSILFSVMRSDDVIKEREAKIKKMFSVANQKLGVDSKFSENPEAVITVMKWREYSKPDYVRMHIPDKFDEDEMPAFLKQFNQLFGQITSWVTDSQAEDTQGTGLDREKGLLYLKAVPPLPMKAPWMEHYVTDPGIAWSFFPIGLGIEDGVELPNPETGETENVIGFDVSGLEADAAKKAGYNVSGKITTAPQVFVGGSTGSGKSLPIETPIKVLVKDEESH